jgi:hypothetical protein
MAFNDDFLRAVMEAHSRARIYAACTPRRSILHFLVLNLDPVPKRAQIGNVFPGPKKHRLPHFDRMAERSLILLGASSDHLRIAHTRHLVLLLLLL